MSLPRWLVVGAGSFGTAITKVLGARPVDVTLAARSEQQVNDLVESGINERYFPGIELPKDTQYVTVDEASKKSWDVIVFAVPSSSFAQTVELFSGCAPLFLSLGKGLDESGHRLSQVATKFVSPESFVTLSGPNIAREMMLDLPTAAVAAGTNKEAVLAIQEIITGQVLRVYASLDLIGVELAGASKNVIAIAAGVLEGAGFGDNAIAAMMTRGLGEMARLGLAHGAELQTYLGLAGVGDLMVTCRSPHSRNHRAGRMFAEGLAADEIRSKIGQAVEGMRTAPIVVQMGHDVGVSMSICTAVSEVVTHDMPLSDVVKLVMSRPPGFEFAEIDMIVATQ